MKISFYLVLFLLSGPIIYGQEEAFKITASADLPCQLLIKRSVFNSEIVDTVHIKNRTAKLNIYISKPGPAIIETDQQQLTIWMIPGHTLDIVIKNNQFAFGGQAALYADYFHVKQINFINFCHNYALNNDSFNESSKGYMDFLDSVSYYQVKCFKKYFPGNRSMFMKQFMEAEMQSIYYENLSRKLLYGDYTLEKFKFYQKIYDVKPSSFYNYSDKISFTNPDLIDIYTFQQFAAQFVIAIALKKQKETSPNFSFAAYFTFAMQTIEKLTGKAATMDAIKAIVISKMVEQLEYSFNRESCNILKSSIAALAQASGNKQFAHLESRLDTILLAKK
jgi:hypothetical protein